MSQRIVKRGNKYCVQVKIFLFWWINLAETLPNGTPYRVEFDTLKEVLDYCNHDAVFSREIVVELKHEIDILNLNTQCTA